MGKLMNWVGGVINRMAYIWLVTSEAFAEICYVGVGDSVRGIVSAAETRQQAPKVEPRTHFLATIPQPRPQPQYKSAN
jgi:hypothetical protein